MLSPSPFTESLLLAPTMLNAPAQPLVSTGRQSVMRSANLLEDHVANLNGSWMKAPVGSRDSYSNVCVDLTVFIGGFRLWRRKHAPELSRSIGNVPFELPV